MLHHKAKNIAFFWPNCFWEYGWKWEIETDHNLVEASLIKRAEMVFCREIRELQLPHMIQSYFVLNCNLICYCLKTATQVTDK